MIGSRSRYSLAQFLELYKAEFVDALVNKYGIRISVEEGRVLTSLVNCLQAESDEKLLSLFEEIVRTSGDLSTRINPKYRYRERFSDLCRCLQLDGYIIDGAKLVQTDPSISDAPPLDDDLIRELQASGLPDAEEVVRKINDSSELFRSTPPNYNGCLNDIRVALETLARAIVTAQKSASTPLYDQPKWGAVLSILRNVDFITQEEEKGLAGVYGFVSPGSHQPLGISDEQMARLGRSLALGMCWFLVKTYQAR